VTTEATDTVVNPAVPTARPAWFQARQRRQPPAADEVESSASGTETTGATTKAPPPPPLVVVDESHSARLWKRIIIAVSLVNLGWGVIASGILHGLAIVVLGVIVFQQHNDGRFQIDGAFDAPLEEAVLDSKMELEVGGPAAKLEFIAATDATGDLETLAAMSDQIAGALTGNKDGSGDGGEGNGINSMSSLMTAPAKAITRGSFTVWTKPEDPTPGLPYLIIIQVKLPKEVKGYRLRDLKGFVRGTDGYQKPIAFKTTDRRAVVDGLVQVQVFIPGAQQLVRDTINVRSDLLKEEQTIEIVF
jgi:hypothetical protein